MWKKVGDTQHFPTNIQGKYMNCLITATIGWIVPILLVYKDNRLIGLVGRVFTNGPGDRGSIPGRVILKTLKMVLDTFSIIRYVSRVKWSNPEKGVAPSPTHRCNSKWKGSLWVALDYSRLLLLTKIILALNKSRKFIVKQRDEREFFSPDGLIFKKIPFRP